VTRRWDIGNLNIGVPVTLEFVGRAIVGSAGSTVNVAASLINVDQNEIQPANDNPSVSVVINNNNNLVVIKAVDVTEPLEGDTVTFTITVENQGPAQSTSLIVRDPIPAGLTLQNATSTHGSYTG